MPSITLCTTRYSVVQQTPPRWDSQFSHASRHLGLLGYSEYSHAKRHLVLLRGAVDARLDHQHRPLVAQRHARERSERQQADLATKQDKHTCLCIDINRYRYLYKYTSKYIDNYISISTYLHSAMYRWIYLCIYRDVDVCTDINNYI